MNDGAVSSARIDAQAVAAKRAAPAPPPRPPARTVSGLSVGRGVTPGLTVANAGGEGTGGVDLFAEAWGDVPGPESEPEPQPETEPEREPQPASIAEASDLALIHREKQQRETVSWRLDLTDQGTHDAGETAAPKKGQTEAPEPEKPPDAHPGPASQPELTLQEVVPDGDATDSVGGHAAEGSVGTADYASAQKDIEDSAATGVIRGTETFSEAAPADDLTEVGQQEPHSEASRPVAAVATLTPTEEAHQILGAKGKNQAEAMEASKQKRAAKRAARAEQPPADAVLQAAPTSAEQADLLVV